MKKLIIFMLLVISTFAEKIKLEEVYLKNDLVYSKKTEKPYTGLVFETFENGKIKAESNYINGKRTGEFIAYFESGGIQQKSNFNDFMNDGEAISYYENGKIETIIHWKNDKKHGLAKFYKEDGTLDKTEQWENGDIIINGKKITPKSNSNESGIDLYSIISQLVFFYILYYVVKSVVKKRKAKKSQIEDK